MVREILSDYCVRPRRVEFEVRNNRIRDERLTTLGLDQNYLKRGALGIR